MTDPDHAARLTAYREAALADAYCTGQEIGREIANAIGVVMNQDGKPEPAITNEQWQKMVDGDEDA